MSDYIACISSKFLRDGETLTPKAKLVYVLLWTYVDSRDLTKPIKTGVARIATETGFSMTTVKSALKELEKKNFIRRERRFNESALTFLLKKI